MAIDKDVRISIEEISGGAVVEGFGSLLYLTKSGFTAASASGTIKEFTSALDVKSDADMTEEAYAVASIYFGAWAKTPARLLFGKYDVGGEAPKDVFMKAIEEKKEFFIVGTDEACELGHIADLAKIVDAHKKLYFLQKGTSLNPSKSQATSRSQAVSTVGSILALPVKNLAVFYGEGTSLSVAAAAYLAATDLSEDNASFTLKFKQPTGINPSELSSSQEQVLRDANVNFLIEEFKNTRAIIKNGLMLDGTPIDKVQAVGFIRAKLQTSVYNFLTQNKKIGMSEEGFSLIERNLDSTLEGFVRSGLLSKGQVPINGVDTLVNGYKLVMPDANLLSPTDRQTGVVKGVRLYLAYNYAVVELSLSVVL